MPLPPGNLRRCLTQQPEVRLRLYESLADLAAADPTLLPAILEILVPHVRRCASGCRPRWPASEAISRCPAPIHQVEGES